MHRNQTPIPEIDNEKIILAASSSLAAKDPERHNQSATNPEDNPRANSEAPVLTGQSESASEQETSDEVSPVVEQEAKRQPVSDASPAVFVEDQSLKVIGLLDSSPLSTDPGTNIETLELEEVKPETSGDPIGPIGSNTPLTRTSSAPSGASSFSSTPLVEDNTDGDASSAQAQPVTAFTIEAAASTPTALAVSDSPPTVIDTSTGLALNNGEGLAFPSAVGFGATAEGGRGGEVYIVANLNDSGPGSLREGVEASGPRTIVFEVDGIIDLETPLIVTKPFLTIAGQTAPGDGITLRNAYLNDDTPLQIRADDVVIRHIRARPGPAGLSEEQVQEAQSNGLVFDGKELDGSRLDAIEIKHAENVILDHISASWGSDGTLDTVNADNITVQYSIIAESLGDSIHPKGSHAVGSSFSYGSENATAAFNLYTDHEWRNPRVNGKGPNLGEDPVFQLQHNVSYNTNSYFVDVMGDAHLNAIGNYFVIGPNADRVLKLEFGFQKYDGYDPQLYLLDNLGPSNGYVLSAPGDSAANWDEGLVADRDTTGSSSTPIGTNSPFYSAIPFDAPEILKIPSDTVFDYVLNNAGAMNLGDNGDRRDDTDLRNVEEVRDGTGGLIDHPDEVGGWDVPKQGVAPEDLDRDGMADSWERSVGLNPDDASDRNGDLFDTGYTNLEIYLAALAGDVIIVPNDGPGEPENQSPVVSDISLTGGEDQPFTFSASDFTDAFSDSDGDSLSLVRIDSLPANGALTLSGQPVTAGQEISTAQLGLLAFLPDADWNGETSFTWSGHDGTDFSAQAAAVTLTVDPVNDVPIVSNFSLSGGEDQSIAFAASDFANAFFDSDGDALNLVRIDSLPANGALTLNGQPVTAGQEISAAQLGLLAFLPNADWNGETQFSWSGHDGTDFSSQAATVSLLVDPVNEAPVVSDISLSGNEDETIAFDASDFTGAFSDGNGDTLNLVKIETLPANGALTLSGQPVTAGNEIPAGQLGLLAFLPDADWNGETQFSWSGHDGTAFSIQAATVTLSVEPVNDSPIANNDTGFAADAGASILIEPSDLTQNDNDPEGDLLVVVTVGNAVHGTVLLSGEADAVSQLQTFSTESGTLGDLTPLTNSLVTFVPEEGYSGPAQFDYTVSDTLGATSSATVFVDIEEGSGGPELILTGAEDNIVRFAASDFEASFQDPVLANSLAKIKVTSLPDNGVLLLNGAEVLTGNEIAVSDLSGLAFQPDPNWNGETQFAWTGYGEDNIWMQVRDAKIVIESVNDWPVATDDSGFIAFDDVPLTIQLEEILSNDTDADLDLLTVQSVGDAQNGNVELVGDAINFTPHKGASGNASFDYAVSDGKGGYATATVSLTVMDNQAEPVELVARAGSLTERDGDQYWGDVKVSAENWDGSEGEVFLSLEYGTRGLSVAGGRSENQIDFSVADQDGDGIGGDSEKLVFDYGKDVAEIALQLGRLRDSEHGGNVEIGSWKAFDSSGELVGHGLLDPREGLAVGQDLYEFQITAELPFSTLVVSANPYNDVFSEDFPQDSSDFKIAKMTYTPATEAVAAATAETQTEDFGATLAATETGLSDHLFGQAELDEVVQVM